MAQEGGVPLNLSSSHTRHFGIAAGYSNSESSLKFDETRHEKKLTDGGLVSLADMPSVTSPTSCAQRSLHATVSDDDFTQDLSQQASKNDKFTSE